MISQLQVLCKVLNTNDYSLIALNNLSDDQFFNYKAEFNFIKNHYGTYGTVPDKLTFANTFPEFDFVEVKEPNNYLLEQLYKDYDQAYLASQFNMIKKYLESGDVDGAKSYFLNSVDKLHQNTSLTWTNVLEDTSRYDRYLDKTVDSSAFYCSTGLPELDLILGGIDRKNENMVICARPGQGKSYILAWMAVAAAKQGLNTGIYSGEMSTDKMGYRIDTILGGIKNQAMNRGDLFIQKEYKHYMDTLSTRAAGKLNIITPNDIPGEPTVGALQAFIEKAKLDILFIDQYSLLTDQRNAKTRTDRMANISKDVKQLQVLTGIPIIAASQLNREKNEDENHKKYIDTANIAESDRISQDATTIIALEQKRDEGKQDFLLTLNIIKARDGGTGSKLQYHADFSTGMLDYIPNDEDDVATEEDFSSMSASYAPESEGNVF